MASDHPGFVTISPLLKRLATLDSAKAVGAEELAAAVALTFTDRISPVQLGVLCWALHATGQDHQPDVLSACAASMRGAAPKVDVKELQRVVAKKGLQAGTYGGGLVCWYAASSTNLGHGAADFPRQCDIVGTGGDGHNTYNVSTTASILASSMVVVAKHGNNSSTSISGAADLLQNAAPRPPVIAATNNRTLPGIYEKSNYAFLYAREWHPAVRYGHPVRKEIPVRTIFNLLGPLANPVHDTGMVEARILGVARQEIGLNFAEALQLSGVKKALVVCGDENLDEVSCAGPSHCWHVHAAGDGQDVEITKFTVTPADFGLPCHPLADVHGGKSPVENARILLQILRNELAPDDPVLHFVLINTAALLAVSGVCEAAESALGADDDGKVITERGPGGLRWKEGVRRARWSISSSAALAQWEAYVEATNAVPT